MITLTAIDTIKIRIEKGDLKPYDDSSMLLFLNALESHPKLKDSLDCQLKTNNSWVEKASNGQIWFILNDNSWKRKRNLPFEPNLKLTFVGKEGSPTISINV